jgi:hypothetical protein
MRSELRFWYFQTCVTCCSQPSVHGDADFSEGLFRRATECHARLQIRDVGDAGAVVLGPEHDGSGSLSLFEPQSELLYHILQLTYLVRLSHSSHDRSEMRHHKPGGRAFTWPLIPDFAPLVRATAGSPKKHISDCRIARIHIATVATQMSGNGLICST